MEIRVHPALLHIKENLSVIEEFERVSVLGDDDTKLFIRLLRYSARNGIRLKDLLKALEEAAKEGGTNNG